MGLLSFERGASTLGQQFGFERELDEITRLAQRNGSGSRSARSASAWPTLEPTRDHALEQPAHAHPRRPAPLSGAAYIAKLYWARLHRDLGELFLDAVGHRRPGRCDGFALRAESGPAPVPLHPGRHDLWRIEPDPAQHHRRTSPGPAARTAESEVGDPVPVPPYVEGHRLLEGRTVVVTAAAGTGIGSAVARRCIEEGATVLVSDAHERRLGRDGRRALRAGRRRVVGVRCNVTVQADIDGLFARRDRRAGPHRRAGQQRRAGRHGRGGGHDRRAVEPRARRHPDRDVPRHPGGAGPHGAARSRRDRQQRLGAGLAGPGRSGPLRRGQGRGHGPHPLHGHRGGPVGRTGQRGGAQPGHAPVPGQGHLRRPARRADHPRGLRPSPPSRGRSPT